jgi:multidrug resistance efflux pump
MATLPDTGKYFSFAKGHNPMISVKVVAALAVLAVLGGVVCTQKAVSSKDDDAKPAKTAAKETKKPATHKVEKKPFRIELSVKGILESEEAKEILFRPQPMVIPPPTHGGLAIVKVVEHGSSVRKGDPLITFDTRKLDEVIRDVEVDKKVLDASIKLAEEDLPPFEKSVPVELAAAGEADKRAREDLKYFLEVGRPQAQKEADFYLKMSTFFLEYAQEELAQLEKMYKANDLTEETEKIILRRYRHRVDMAKFFVRSAQIDRDYTLKVTLPRRELTLKESLLKQAIHLEKTRNTLAPTVAQKHETLARMRHDRDKFQDRIDKMKKDRAAMVIHSPIDGIVYHGKLHRGHWTLSSTLENRLAPHGSVMPEEVFMTVVKPRPVHVRVNIEEKDAHLVRTGLQGRVKLVFNPDMKVTATVQRISPLPTAPGQYEALIAVAEEGDAGLMPGMACSVKFVPYAKKDALSVPAAAVFEEDDKHFVFVAHKDGKHEKRDVRPGRTAKQRTEIVAGLREGEEILQERPDEAATTAAEKGVTP